MADLINMKMGAEERSEQRPVEPKDSAPQYPWGLRISLNNDDLEKLGLTDMPKAGSAVMITAKAVVASVRTYSSADLGKSTLMGDEGENENSMDLQITDMRVKREGDLYD
jgi:hypothetical protein